MITERKWQAMVARIEELEAKLAAERERGFWLGRSCGGSKAEIDAALAAIREGGGR